MTFVAKLKRFFNKYLFNAKWCCNICGKEIFSDKYFCEKCESSLPYNDGYICQHCGRKVIAPEEYCSTCKNNLISLDKCRSLFVYQKPISNLILSAKYNGNRYLLKMFAQLMAPLYFKHYFNADYLCYVPMTDKAFRKRGYNQSKILAEELSNNIGVQVLDCIKKTKETTRQAKLGRKERLKNLVGVFKVFNKKLVKGKSLLLVDDVSTTGSTAQVIAEALKKAGAKNVYCLSVASVPPYEGY